jgi:hypothetical protein
MINQPFFDFYKKKCYNIFIERKKFMRISGINENDVVNGKGICV